MCYHFYTYQLRAKGNQNNAINSSCNYIDSCSFLKYKITPDTQRNNPSITSINSGRETGRIVRGQWEVNCKLAIYTVTVGEHNKQ